jgi:uncharacterized protein YecA (UPF0149 family)
MGAIGESIAEYAKPLLDETDGSIEQMNHALKLGMLCWNLALLPEEERDSAVNEMQPGLEMDDAKFEAFRRTIVVPMIRRHIEMFPRMHQIRSKGSSIEVSASQTCATTPVSREKYPGTGRNAPCPCNSGQKYKRCCGR